jgi:hypothetical protein
MIVEGEKRFPCPFEQCDDRLDFIEREGFPSDVQQMICGKAIMKQVERCNAASSRCEAAQSWFPGYGDAVISGRYPVRNELPVRVHEGDIMRKQSIGARHDLPFEGIAMDVDNAREDEGATGIKNIGIAGKNGLTDLGNVTVPASQVSIDQSLSWNKTSAIGDHQIALLHRWCKHEPSTADRG